MSWTSHSRQERFKNYLDQIIASVDDNVPIDILESVKCLLQNNTTVSIKDVQKVLRTKGHKYYEFCRQIADRLNRKDAINIPDDLKTAMISKFASISSYQLHCDACDACDACESPTRLSLPPMHYIARKLAIELGASPEVVGLFPMANSVAKNALFDAYWVRLRYLSKQTHI